MMRLILVSVIGDPENMVIGVSRPTIRFYPYYQKLTKVSRLVVCDIAQTYFMQTYNHTRMEKATHPSHAYINFCFCRSFIFEFIAHLHQMKLEGCLGQNIKIFAL